MKHMTQLFGKKALSIICVIAIILSAVSVSFGALATETNDATHYVVNANTSPALPLFAGTKVDLDNVDVIFSGDEAATNSAEITWALEADYGKNLSLDSENVLTALKKGNTYKVIATAGEKTETLWAVVAEETDSAWNLYSIDFDAYTEDYSKLTYQAEPLTEAHEIINPDGAVVNKKDTTTPVTTSLTSYIFTKGNTANPYWVHVYQKGAWSYDGVAFDYNGKTGAGTIPSGAMFPAGWSSYVTAPGSYGVATLYKVPHVMPYDLSAGLNTNEDINAISAARKGIMPFANPYLFDGNNLSEVGYKVFNTFLDTIAGQRNDTKGYFILNNDITKAFSDYTVNVNLDTQLFNVHDGKYGGNEGMGISSSKMVNLYGRMPVDANGMPVSTATYTGTIKSYNGSGELVETTDSIYFQSISVCPFWASVYGSTGKPVGATVARLDFYNTNARSAYATPYGSDPNSETDSAFKVTRWDYLKSKSNSQPQNNVASNTGANVNMSVKYEGTTATVTSVNDSENTEIVFNDVFENKGAIALGMDSMSNSVDYSATTGPKALAPWMNVHQFSIDLVNDITAENDGSEYPVYEKHYYQPVVDASLEEGYTDIDADEKYFLTITEAIDYLDGKGGKVYIKGMYEGAGAAFEGTLENRKPIILSGYKDSATTVVGEETINNGILNNASNTSATNWAKGDITFQYMYIDTNQAGTASGGIDSGRVNYNFGSGGHTLTFGYGLQTVSNNAMDDILVGNYPDSSIKDANFNIYSGTYSSVAPFNTIAISNPITLNMNANINVYGGTVRTMSVGSFMNVNNNGTRVVTINGDVNFGIYGGRVNSLNLLTQGYRSDIKVTGNVVVDVSGGTVTSTLAQLGQGNYAAVCYATGYQPVLRGNMALIVDGSNSNIKINSTGGIPNLEQVQMAENKYMIAIINNYTGTGATFDTTSTYKDYEYYTTESGSGALRQVGDAKSILDRWHYKITVKGGEARPYFVRTDANDPASSYLQGFTIVPNEAGLITAVNGVKIEPTGKKTADGLDIYDLSAYMSERDNTADDTDVITITFIDERIPVVSTDESFTPDATIYNKVDTIDEAIASLGAEGGKIYIKGEYTITNMQSEFASTKAVAAGNKIVIAGFGETKEGNTLKFGTADAYVNATTAWMFCDVTFENLNLIREKRHGQNTDFNSNGYVLTFGDGLETSFANFSIGQVVSGVTNNIVINSGTIPHLIASTVNTSQFSTAGTNINYTINGGTFTLGTDAAGANYMGNYDNGNHGKNEADTMVGKSSFINGDITWKINGGDWANKILRTTGRGYARFACHGILRVDIAGGSLSQVQMYVGVENSSNSVDGPIVNKYNNMVVRVDNRYTDTQINSLLTSVDEKAANDGKKYIAIANYADDIYEIVNIEHGLDYVLTVYDGEADAVFTGTGADAVLKGFTIVPSKENEGKKVLVNEKEVTPDNDGIYDLSEFEDTGLVIIRFEQDADYSEYVAFRNDFNSSYEKLMNADETVNVVFIGGSVTNGDGLKLVTNGSWRARTTAWLESAFPSKINSINAAVSGTGSTAGVYRSTKDIIAKDPDILFIEFSINDAYDGVSYDAAAQQFETIVREVKLANPDCDIATVLVTDQGRVMDAKAGILHDAARAHDAVAKEYGIPAIYVGRALASHFEDGLSGDALSTAWAEYVSDWVHPNDKGYGIYTATVRNFLEGVYSGSYTAENKNIDVTDPDTIVSDTLADGNRTLIMGSETVTVEQSHKAPVISSSVNLQTVLAASNAAGGNGFTFKADVAGSTLKTTGVLQIAKGTSGKLVYTFTGTDLSIFGNLDTGDKIYYTLDGGEEQTVTLSGTTKPRKVFAGIEAGEHTVELRFEFAAAELNIAAIATRDASKATGYEEIIFDEEINVEDYKASGDVPQKNYYLFAGWYADASSETAMTAAQLAEAETAVAKFIPKAVLDIKWQIAKGEDGTANLRLISTVDSLQYQKVIFNVDVVGRATPFKPLESTTVYTGISGYVDGNEQNYAPTINSDCSKYFMTHIIKGIPVDFHDNDFTVTASVVTKDGKVITGDPITFQLKNATDYDKVMGN